MAKTETIRIRVEPSVKKAAEAIFSKLGMTASDAVNLFYRQVEMQRGLPFELKIPNRATRKAMKDAREGKNLNSYSSLEELMAKFR